MELLEERSLLSASGAEAILPPGVRPGDVAGDIVHSAEAFYDEVSAAYQHYLGRSVDATGVAYWVSCRAAGMTAEQLEAKLVSSVEYRGSHGSTNDAWVRSIFQDVLGRAGQTGEVQAAIAQLGQGASLFTVASELTSCREHETQLVMGYYQRFLGRAGSQAEVQAWVDQLVNGGQTQEGVKASFLLSDEYIQTHAATFYRDQHQPDPGAVYFYTPLNMLKTGTEDQYLREHGGDSVDWLFGAYRDVLGRRPELTGLNGWLGTLGSNTHGAETPLVAS
jgi:hypothetical protein